MEIENEPPPKLIVDRPLPGPLGQGIFQAQCRVENVRIVPVFGAGALKASPRLGHLHKNVDDLPWWWAEASENNTIDIAGLPPGEHKVKIELVDANHNVFPGQVVTVAFTVPTRTGSESHGWVAIKLARRYAQRHRAADGCLSLCWKWMSCASSCRAPHRRADPSLHTTYDRLAAGRDLGGHHTRIAAPTQRCPLTVRGLVLITAGNRSPHSPLYGQAW